MQKYVIKESVGPCSLSSFWGIILPVSSSFWWSQAFLCLWLHISILRLHLSMATYPLCVSVASSFLSLPLDLRSVRNPVWYHLKSLHYICKDSVFKWFAYAQINLFDGHYGTHYCGWVHSEEVLSKEASWPWAESWGRISPGRRDGWRMLQETRKKPSDIEVVIRTET